MMINGHPLAEWNKRQEIAVELYYSMTCLSHTADKPVLHARCTGGVPCVMFSYYKRS
jgi:hypothetical protein